MFEATNKNSRIVQRVTQNGKFRTETKYRDWGSDSFAVSTDGNNATVGYIDFEGGQFDGGETVKLSGHQLRTLYRVLQKHYEG